jgi:hypothetical protein
MSFWIQLDTLFKLKTKLFFRTFDQFCFQIFFPAFIILIGIIVISINIIIQPPALILDDSLYPEGFSIFNGGNSLALLNWTNVFNNIKPSLLTTKSSTLSDWDSEIFLQKSAYVKGGIFTYSSNS